VVVLLTTGEVAVIAGETARATDEKDRAWRADVRSRRAMVRADLATPGCLSNDSAGSQKHPMPNVASRTAEREVLRPVAAADANDVGNNDGGDDGRDGVDMKAAVTEAWPARTKKLVANASVGVIMITRFGSNDR